MLAAKQFSPDKTLTKEEIESFFSNDKILYKKKIEKQALEFFKAKSSEALGSTKDVILNKTITEIAEKVSNIVEGVVDLSHDYCKMEKCLTAKGRHAFDGSQKIFEDSPTL